MNVLSLRIADHIEALLPLLSVYSLTTYPYSLAELTHGIIYAMAPLAHLFSERSEQGLLKDCGMSRILLYDNRAPEKEDTKRRCVVLLRSVYTSVHL